VSSTRILMASRILRLTAIAIRSGFYMNSH